MDASLTTSTSPQRSGHKDFMKMTVEMMSKWVGEVEKSLDVKLKFGHPLGAIFSKQLHI